MQATVAGERIFEITTALGEGALAVHRFQARQGLGRLTEIELELLSPRNDLAFDKILGTSATVKLETASGTARPFNGYVTRFSHTGFMTGRQHQYRASLRTWPWFLTRAADCRIFQNQSVPEILKEIFKKYSDSKLEDKLT